VVPTRQSSAPSWVHVFSKSSSPSSLRTQIAAAAHLDATSPKVFHRRFRRAKRKRKKTKGLLEEVFLPANLFTLSSELIDREIIVFDGGNPHTPPIKPPYGVHWQSLSVRRLHIQDNIEPNIGLTAPRMGYDISPFIRLPRQMSLDIIGEMGLQQIVVSLLACETLRRTTLLRGDHKRVFTDYGKPVRYTCVGPQPSRNSKLVRPHPPFMQSLPECHWESLLWLMKRAEICFRTIADSRVISHLDHAKKLVNYQTFKSGSTDDHSKFNAEFFGGIGFGTNVFLRCHTDADFTMSIIQVFLKGKEKYSLDDDVIVYFCFPTIGLAVPLRPGDYLLFNARIPHCLSSRCKYEDEIITTSTYLKTAIVGMNNNDLPLTTNQARKLRQLK
jgi:hypothetical protein